MAHTEHQRRMLALLLAAMIIILTIFISLIGRDMTNYHQTLTSIETYAQAQIEKYLGLALRINEGFLSTIEHDWQAYKTVTSEIDFMEFGDDFLRSLTSSAYFSVILTSSGERYYTQPEYKNLAVILEDIPADGKPHILFADGASQPFGTGERFYVAGRLLHADDQIYRVYVGFLEQIMYGNFINSLDLDLVDVIKSGLNQTLNYVLALLVFVILFGAILVYHAHKLRVVVYQDIVEEMGGTLVNGAVYGRRTTDRR